MSGIYILSVALIIIIIIFGYGSMNNNIFIENNDIIIKGMYGETIDMEKIQSIELTSSIPAIGGKINGYILGNTRKGYFRTVEAEKVKLLLNSNKKPVILIIKLTGEKIYFSGNKKSNKEIFAEIEKTFKPGP